MRNVPREDRPGDRCCERFGVRLLKTISERPLIGHGSLRYRLKKVAALLVAATRVEPRFTDSHGGMADRNVPCNF